MPTPNYTKYARLDPIIGDHIIDGDSVSLTMDLGHRIYHGEIVRLQGLNTAESHGASRVEGLAAARVVRDWRAAAEAANPTTPWPLIVVTIKDKTEKYGRLLAVIYARGDPVSLNEMLLTTGWGKPYDGTGPRP